MQVPSAETTFRKPSPELQASIFSLLTWHWINPLVNLGNRKILQIEDLYELNPDDRTSTCWQLLREATRDDEGPIVIWNVLLKVLGRAYFMAVLWKPLWLVAVVLQVYILKALVRIVERNSKEFKWWWSALLVLAMFTAATLQTVAQNNLFNSCQRLSMRARCIVTMAIHNKVLSLKVATSGMATDTGMLLNLLSNDTQKLVDAGGNFHFAWFALVEILVVSCLIILEAGLSAVPGVVLVLVLQPLPVWMGWAVGRSRRKAMVHTDARVRLLGDLLAGIRTVKFNGWTVPFLLRISCIRRSELSWIRKATFLKFLILSLKDGVVPVSALVILFTYANLHKKLTASMAFSVMALLSILVRVFNFAPTGIQYAWEAFVSLQRLQRFFNICYRVAGMVEDQISCTHCEASACVKDGWFTCEHPESMDGVRLNKGRKTDMESFEKFKPILKGVNLTVKKGQLVGIIGNVGSGKSSLLLSLLGELKCVKGLWHVELPVAYVPQLPWLFNGTVRENIIFGSQYDASHYQEILMACALEHDVRNFPAGDDTEIGERGLNLSGGQKARINLARACYSSCQLLLLDDPFAAVDVVTANHLIEHVLLGVLKGRTIILTTHNKNALKCCNEIYIMDDGKLQLHNEKEKTSCNDVVYSEGLYTVQSDHECSGIEYEDKAEKIILNSECHPFGTSSENVSLIAEKCPGSFGIDGVNKDRNTCIQNAPLINNTLKLKETVPIGYHNVENIGNNKKCGALIVKEDRIEGRLTWETLRAYLKAGRYSNFTLVLGMFLLTQAARVMISYWVAVWADGMYNLNLQGYVGIYSCIVAGAILLSVTRALAFSYVTTLAAKSMHERMAKRIFNSPLLFFEENLAGRILNRLGKDQACIDDLLPNAAQSMLENIVGCLGSIVIVATLIPWFLLVLPLFFGVLIYFQRRYTAVSRELKRLDGVSRSPIFVHFTEEMQGLASIHAYHAEEKMRMQLERLIDDNHSAYVLFLHVSRWLSIRLDIFAALCVTFSALLVVLFHHRIAPGIAGAVLVQSLQMTGLLQYGIRMAADTENHFISVERVRAYANLQQEFPLCTPAGLISNDWPSKGEVEFINYTMSYRKYLPAVLNNVSFKVHSRDRIGILGRTGAGKSSLVLAMFRIVVNSACSGSILIDAVDISMVGANELRQRMSLVPQDPVLFKETIRMNLDPFQHYTDGEIYEALSASHLINKVQSFEKGLYSVIGDNGIAFSVGECQLLCLARAILRRSRVLVMDEATSSVDLDTEKLINKVLQRAFQPCTVLTIAHRISSVNHCNRFLLLARGGSIKEFDDLEILAKSMNECSGSTLG